MGQIISFSNVRKGLPWADNLKEYTDNNKKHRYKSGKYLITITLSHIYD